MANRTFIDDNQYSNFSVINQNVIRDYKKDKTAVMNQLGIVKSGLFGHRNKKGQFLSKQAFASILEAYRQKQKRIQELKATMQVVKSQEAYADMQKELANISKQIAEMKMDILKKSPLSQQATQNLVVQVEENPSVDVSSQLASEPEVSEEVVKDVKQDEKVVEQIKTENGASESGSKIPKWLLPTLVIGGIAYFLFRKK